MWQAAPTTPFPTQVHLSSPQSVSLPGAHACDSILLCAALTCWTAADAPFWGDLNCTALALVAGSGFCILNDAAVASEVLLREGLVRRVLILDLDVHQVSTPPGCPDLSS